MTTSGTVGATTIDVVTLIEHAYRRCGKSTGQITAEMAQAARNNLYFYLSNLGNHGINLWTVSRDVYGVTYGKSSVDLPVGTIDVLNANYRTLQRPSGTGATSAGGTASYAFDADLTTACTQTSANGNISYAYSSATMITSVGVMTNGSASLTPVFEYTEDGTTWSTLFTPSPDQGATTIAFTDKTWKWWDIPAPQSSAVAYRLRETGGATLNIREFYLGNTPQEIPMSRLNRDDYSALPNKAFVGQPLQFWVDRQINYPVLNTWPTPNDAFGQIVTFRHRQIQDVSALLQTVEVPQRWQYAIMTNLAAMLALEMPDVDPARIAMLDQSAQRATYEAEQEERDKSPIYYVPGIAVYSR
jgi:hypothetical protein